MYLRIGKVATMIGVSISTLRRWDETNIFAASYKTVGGHRRYKLVKILLFCNNIRKILPGSDQIPNKTLRVVTYALVSSSRQKDDLKRQQDYLEHFAQKRQWTLLKAYRDGTASDTIVYLTLTSKTLEKAKELSTLKDIGLLTYLEDMLQQSIHKEYNIEQES